MELDRDIRTVFAYNLNLRADEKDIFKFFSQAGTVVDVRIISDRNTRKSKGFAYIEMEKRVRPFRAGHVCIQPHQPST
jgi:RNA-binding protein 39